MIYFCVIVKYVSFKIINCINMTNNINPSGVQVVPQPQSHTLTLSIPANSPNNSDMNSDKNSDGELLQIAGKSIFDHDKID